MATIVPKSSDDARRLIAALLRLVPDRDERRRRIKPTTAGKRIAYEVDDELLGLLSFTDAADVGVDGPKSPESPDTSDSSSEAASDEQRDADGRAADQDPLPTGDFAPADPPLVSGEPVVPVAPEVPDRNDKTEAWAEYMAAAFPDYDPAGKARKELIAEYDRRTAATA